MLRVVGMSDTMRLKNRGGDEAINRRISLLVLNHDTQAQIEKENAESDAVQLSDPQSMKEITAPAQPSAADINPDHQPSQAAPVSQEKPVTDLPPAPASPPQPERDSQQR